MTRPGWSSPRWPLQFVIQEESKQSTKREPGPDDYKKPKKKKGGKNKKDDKDKKRKKLDKSSDDVSTIIIYLSCFQVFILYRNIDFLYFQDVILLGVRSGLRFPTKSFFSVQDMYDKVGAEQASRTHYTGPTFHDVESAAKFFGIDPRSDCILYTQHKPNKGRVFVSACPIDSLNKAYIGCLNCGHIYLPNSMGTHYKTCSSARKGNSTELIEKIENLHAEEELLNPSSGRGDRTSRKNKVCRFIVF